MIPAIKLVQGDTAPDIDITLTDEDTGAAINVSNGGDVVKLYFRKVGETTLEATITATKPNGGADGLVRFTWPSTALEDEGAYQGEIEITFSTGKKQTMYDILKFKVREQIG
jgi:hypothetical protein